MSKNKKGLDVRAMIDGVAVYCSHDEIVDIMAVIPNPKNPNTHPKKQIDVLAKVIKAQGWRKPITVSTRSGFVVSGHGRLMAALAMGASQVPVDYQNYATEADEYADLIADNRIAELSETDADMLDALLKELGEQEGFDMALTGYDNVEHDLDEEFSGVDIDSFFADADAPAADQPDEKKHTVTCPHCGAEVVV